MKRSFQRQLYIDFEVIKRSISFNPYGKTSDSYAAGYYSSVRLNSSNAWDDGYEAGKKSVPATTYVDQTITANGTYSLNKGIGTLTVAVPVPDAPEPTPSLVSPGINLTAISLSGSNSSTTTFEVPDATSSTRIIVTGNWTEAAAGTNNAIRITNLTKDTSDSRNKSGKCAVYYVTSIGTQCKITLGTASGSYSSKITSIVREN